MNSLWTVRYNANDFHVKLFQKAISQTFIETVRFTAHAREYSAITWTVGEDKGFYKHTFRKGNESWTLTENSTKLLVLQGCCTALFEKFVGGNEASSKQTSKMNADWLKWTVVPIEKTFLY